jgi:hypothetical protein
MPGKYSVRNDTQCPAHGAAMRVSLVVALVVCVARSAVADAPEVTAAASNDFPTLARVEFVQECINRTGGKQTNMYQCACVVDRIAEHLKYDAFVEASTFARYSTLPGEGAGIFRDTDEARQKAKTYRQIEAQAFQACNLKAP